MTQTSTTTRTSPIAHDLKHAAGVAQTLSHPTDTVKVAAKGPGLVDWANKNGIILPANLYDIQTVGDGGFFVRVGTSEIVLECKEGEPLLAKIEAALSAESDGVYRVEQHAATFELRGPKALLAFAQTCGLNLAEEPAGRVVYTRIAGVSCGILVLDAGSNRTYRVWVDYTLAPYLWETLVEIISELA